MNERANYAEICVKRVKCIAHIIKNVIIKKEYTKKIDLLIKKNRSINMVL